VEGLVGWYLRVLAPGVVPTTGTISLVERHAARVTVAAVHNALQDRGNAYPELAALDVLSVNVRAALLREGRDVTGGVPESDEPDSHVT
jgi:MOSC domain-containing protein YiiM